MSPLSQLDFDQALADADGLVLVDFWASWCGPCKVVGPILTRLAPDYQGRVDFYQVDADENRRLMEAFGIRSIPTVLLLRPHRDRPGAAVLGQRIGANPPAAYVELIERGLHPKPSILSRIGRLFGGE
jgi:thioredoxin